MAKHIILVHGRNYKPNKESLTEIWIDALAHGINRDHGTQTLQKFQQTEKTMAYYGDLSNSFLAKHTGKLWTKKREKEDISNRLETLEGLKQYKKKEFNKTNYKKIRDLSDVFKEFTASMLSSPLSLFGIGDDIVGMVAPDMEHYWNADSQFGSDVRWRLTVELQKALERGDDIMLIAHSLGSIASYDVLWKFSHYAEYKNNKKMSDKKINTLITLGCPLGDENVKNQLKGTNSKFDRRYPHNIGRWINFAAEDDYISHDTTVADDYKQMKKLQLTTSITDKPIYNMAVHNDNLNPHQGTGYLIHSKVCQAVASWLEE